MFKILRQLDNVQEFSIFTNQINGRTISELFKNNYCGYYMSKFNFPKESPFLKMIKKESVFAGATFHTPILNILEVLDGKKSSK